MKNTDSVRSHLRQALPKQAYFFGSHVLNATQIIRTNGIRTYFQLYNPNPRKRPDVLSLKGFPYPIHYRPGTADVNTIVQNLIREEYGQLPPRYEATWIIDGGGYIGDASIFFLRRFPDCRILCLEPDVQNHAYAALNLYPYSDRVTLLNKGLWGYSTRFSISGSFLDVHLKECPVGDGDPCVEVVDIETLMEDYQIERIDILKLDVEGAEEHILQTNSKNWLRKVRAIVIEFHGQKIRQESIKFLNDNGFVGYQFRSLYYFFTKSAFGTTK